MNPALLSRLTQLGERGSAARRCHEVRVSTTTHTARHDDYFLAITHQVGNGLARFLGFFVVLAHDRANRNLEHQILTTGTMHLRALAMRAALRLEMMLEAIIDERGHACIGFHTKQLVGMGMTRAELEDMLGVCIVMGGGPSLMYATGALAAYEEFGGEKAAA